jgi:hypothetical protein
MISAIDGSINGGGGVDKFRIKIWNGNTVIYDNNMGELENGDPSTALGGGSIKIHDGKRNSAPAIAAARPPAESDDVAEVVKTAFDVQVLGNPSTSSFKMKVTGNISKEEITLRVVDVKGNVLDLRRKVIAGQIVEFGNQYRAGTYYVEVRQGTERKVITVIKLN